MCSKLTVDQLIDMAHGMNIGSWKYNSSTKTISWPNGIADDTNTYTYTSYPLDTFITQIAVKDRDGFLKYLNDIEENSAPLISEFSGSREKEPWNKIEIIGANVARQSGQVYGLVRVVKAENDQLFSYLASLFDIIGDHAMCGILMVRKDWFVGYMNSIFRSIAGVPIRNFDNDLRFDDLAQYLSKHFIESVLNAFDNRKVLREQSSVTKVENGVACDWVVYPITDNKGNRSGLFIVLKKVTPASKLSKNPFAIIANSLDKPVVIVSKSDGALIFANMVAKQTYSIKDGIKYEIENKAAIIGDHFLSAQTETARKFGLTHLLKLPEGGTPSDITVGDESCLMLIY